MMRLNYGLGEGGCSPSKIDRFNMITRVGMTGSALRDTLLPHTREQDVKSPFIPNMYIQIWELNIFFWNKTAVLWFIFLQVKLWIIKYYKPIAYWILCNIHCILLTTRKNSKMQFVSMDVSNGKYDFFSHELSREWHPVISEMYCLVF